LSIEKEAQIMQIEELQKKEKELNDAIAFHNDKIEKLESYDDFQAKRKG
jgi:hypothetical protein